VLSPLLFLIYINDLPTEEDPRTCQTSTLLFADDIALLPAHRFLHLPLPYLISAVQRSLDAFSKWCIKWKMKFNIKKSSVVLFSRANTQPAFSPLILSAQPLPSSPLYKYLGVLLDEKLHFKEHANKVMATLYQQSFLITRTISPKRNPSPATVRSLVLSKLYSYLAYSLPFWKPTAVQCRKINSSLTAPLRASVCLPYCTSRMALFLEFRCLPTDILRKSLIFKFFRKLSLAPPSPFSIIFNFFATLPKPPLMVSTVLELDRSLPLSHNTPNITNRAINASFVQALHRKCVVLQKGKYLLQLYRTPIAPRLPTYIRIEQKPLVLIRAKLRFDLTMLNSSAHSRCAVNNAACPHCPTKTETRNHVLLRCPAYSVYRSSLSTALRKPLTLQLILNPPASLLKVTGQFLLAINKLRPI
jgi:hypothetical protein